MGLTNADFLPTLDELITALETNPLQFPEKRRGKLAGTRAAHLAYRGETWRLVFEIDEDFGEVRVLALNPHDRAYIEAERRR